MSTTTRRLACVLGLPASLLLALPAPSTAGTTQIDGPAYYDTSGVVCPEAPSGYDDYPALVLEGDLEGCLYTHVETTRSTPSGVFIETGQELVVGELNGVEGTFTTTYRFQGKFDDSGAEIHGRCQHPIVEGSGTGGFAGASGRLDFKDFIGDTVTYEYRGHIRFR